MISVNRKDKRVEIKIELGSIGWNINFTNERSSEFDATLLEKFIKDELYKHISNMRREAYEEGWKDKASKNTPKRSYHSWHF